MSWILSQDILQHHIYCLSVIIIISIAHI